MKTYTLHVAPLNRGPFASRPAYAYELRADKILANEVQLPCDDTPMRPSLLYVVGNEFGAIAAVWAYYDRDALDTLMNEGLLDSLLISEEDQAEATEEESDEWLCLGNASEPIDQTYLWVQHAVFEPSRDWEVIAKFAEARGAGNETLDF